MLIHKTGRTSLLEAIARIPDYILLGMRHHICRDFADLSAGLSSHVMEFELKTIDT